MSTRSTTKFYEVWRGKETFRGGFYRQCDGYLSGHGVDLKKFLAGKKIINGISFEDDKDKCFNGVGCLGASVIKHFKNGIGDIYLTNENDKQEYNYKIWAEMAGEGFSQPNGTIMIEIENWKNEIIYSGPIDNMPIKEDEEEEDEDN